jgi:hypothetical protein
MNSQLASLERELERLAADFAKALVLTALRARVAELPVLHEGAALTPPHAFPIEVREVRAVRAPRTAPPVREAKRTPPPARPVVSAPAAPPPPRRTPAQGATTSAEQRSRAAERAARPRGERQTSEAFDDVGDTTDTITDPSLLLAVLGATERATERDRESPAAEPSHTSREKPKPSRVPELLTPREAPREEVPVDTSQGPVLRPGERLQRTAGGNVVLRRGGT